MRSASGLLVPVRDLLQTGPTGEGPAEARNETGAPLWGAEGIAVNNAGDCDIAVIGAGAAGLAAARRLAGAGMRVTIVEARGRVGGRIHTLRPHGWPVPVEEGAEFIHGGPQETWSIVRDANLATCEVAESEWTTINGHPRLLEFDRSWSRIFERLETFASDELSFAEFLRSYCSDLPPAEADMATAYVEGFNAADSRLISS